MEIPVKLNAMDTKNGLKGHVNNPRNNEGLHLFNYLVSQLVSKMVETRNLNTTYSIGPHYEMSLL